ncbi:recombinase family protein [Vibrio cholerae]|uniref:recombinase family protein n=1 Tax=Vibrio cholerae TaxID=666 RepID=UPI000662D942|nr:recombinase family protein [Vibrio cholerae]CSB18099.1 Site-specific recombinase [Vibrio cholerae]CSD68326.1 Site-specific recombinase [Vibrio cholerae]HAS3361927.1 recombinase family protein [Vibrio cholerae]
MQPSIYVYRRVSTERQAKADKHGLDIQVRESTLIDLQKQFPNYPVVELANDAGLSAFKAEHIKVKTALKDFIDKCVNGEIVRGSILVVYSLDRLSRLKLGDAYQKVFIPIVENGVQIYSETEARFYSNHDVDYILATVLFSRAHNESKTKSQRNKDAILNGVKRWQQEKKFTPNLTTSPFWIDNKTGEFNPLADAALYMVESLINGVGYKTIADELERRYPTPPQRKTSKAPSFWTLETIFKTRNNRSLIGEKTIKVQKDLEISLEEPEKVKPKKNGEKVVKDKKEKAEDTYTLDGYYPSLISMDTWHKLQKTKANKRRTYSDNTYLLTDLRSLTICGECGYSLAGTANKGGSDERAKYFCTGASSKRSSHTLWKADVETIDRVVLLLLNAGIEEGVKLITSPEYQGMIEDLKNTILSEQHTLSELKTRFERTQSPTMLDLMLTAEERIKQAEERLQELTASPTNATGDNIADYEIEFYRLYRETNFKDLTDITRKDIKLEIAKLLQRVEISPCGFGWRISLKMNTGVCVEHVTTQAITTDTINMGNKYIRQELAYNGLYHYMIRVKNSRTMENHRIIEKWLRKTAQLDNIPSKPNFINDIIHEIEPVNPLRDSTKYDLTYADLELMFKR